MTINFKLRLLTCSQRHGNQRALDPMPGNHGSIVNDILSLIFIFYLQMINRGHADSSMACPCVSMMCNTKSVVYK